MATYGNNILPIFNDSWVVSSGSISAGTYTATASWQLCRYYYSVSEYNVGETALISCANCTGRFTLGIYYWDLETSKLFQTSVDITTAGVSVEVPLQSARVSQIRFVVYCIDPGTIGAITCQLVVPANTSGTEGYSGGTKEAYPVFYSPRRPSGSLQYTAAAARMSTVASLFLRLDPILDSNRDPQSAWVDITAQCTVHPSSYYITTAQSIQCFVALYYGTRIIASEYIVFNSLQDKTVVLHKKLLAEACILLDTIQDVPLRLCVYPVGTASSSYLVVDQDRTFIKAFGTVKKAEQNIVVSAGIDSNNNYNFTTVQVWPSDVHFQVLYSYGKPTTVYMVSKRYYRTYSSGSWVYNTMWYIHSIDLLGPFDTDDDSYSGSITYRRVISDNSIEKMQLAVITDIQYPYSVRGDGDEYLGYNVQTNNTDILRVQLSTSGVLSICKLDGTSSVTLATGVKDFSVVQYGCQNFWYQRTNIYSSNTIRSFSHTLGFTIFYVTETAIKAVMYPDINNQTITSVSSVFSTSAFGTYTVQLPGQFFSGIGSNTFSKIVASPLHVFNEEGDGGQTYGTTLFGLSIYVNGTTYDEWIMGICEFALREGVVTDYVVSTVTTYFACVDYEALGINTYWQNPDGTWSITPSTNTPIWWNWSSSDADTTQPRIDAMGMTAPPTSGDSWMASNIFYQTNNQYSQLNLVCPSSNVNPLTSNFPMPFLHASAVGNYNEVSYSFGYGSFFNAGCIQKLPSGELAELQVGIVDDTKWVRWCPGLLPKTCLSHDVQHTLSSSHTYTYETAGYITAAGTASGVGQFRTYQDNAAQYMKGKHDFYMVLPSGNYPIMLSSGGLMFGTVPTAIKGLSTITALNKPNRATVHEYTTKLNEFIHIGWLPMRTSIP